jgi:anti-sigma B factor antagonist
MGILDLKTEEQGEVVRIALSGELDISSARQVDEALKQVEPRKPPVLVIDLRGLSFMDSTGLRLIASADARAREEGRRLTIVKGPKAVQRVFQITRLDERFEIVEDPSAVLGTG